MWNPCDLILWLQHAPGPGLDGARDPATAGEQRQESQAREVEAEMPWKKHFLFINWRENTSGHSTRLAFGCFLWFLQWDSVACPGRTTSIQINLFKSEGTIRLSRVQDEVIGPKPGTPKCDVFIFCMTNMCGPAQGTRTVWGADWNAGILTICTVLHCDTTQDG